MALDVEEPRARKLTAPPAVMLRAVVASTEWLAIVSARATPIAAEPEDSAAPLAVVAAEAESSAFTSRSPESTSVPSAPMTADEEALEMATATEPAMATEPAAPVSEPVSSMAALVVSLTMFRATDAPMPAFSLGWPSSPGNAFAVEEASDVAVRVASPDMAITVVGGPRAGSERTAAEVSRLTMLSAKEPARPTLPPPAPEVASAANV